MGEGMGERERGGRKRDNRIDDPLPFKVDDPLPFKIIISTSRFDVQDFKR